MKPFLYKKTENDYILPQPQTAEIIQKETEQNNAGYLQTALEFNKVNLTTARENLEKKIDGILDAAADLPPQNVKIDDTPKLNDIFIDDNGFFDNDDLKPEDREYLNNLLEKTNFTDVGAIIDFPIKVEPT